MPDLSEWLMLAQAVQPWPGAADRVALHWQHDLTLLATCLAHFDDMMGDFDRLLQP